MVVKQHPNRSVVGGHSSKNNLPIFTLLLFNQVLPKFQQSRCFILSKEPQVSCKLGHEFKFYRPLNKLPQLSIFPVIKLAKNKRALTPQGEQQLVFKDDWLEVLLLCKDLTGRVKWKSVKSKRKKHLMLC